MTTLSRLFAAAFALICAAALAEARQTDVSVAYVKLAGTMQGVSVQPALQLSPRWTLVGDVSATRGRDCDGCEIDYRDLTALGGFRARWQPTERFSPFTQLLAGALYSKGSEYWAEYCCDIPSQLKPAHTVTYFTVQPGVGFTMMTSRRLGFRGQADLQIAIPDQSRYEGVSMFPRLTMGAVLRMGKMR